MVIFHSYVAVYQRPKRELLQHDMYDMYKIPIRPGTFPSLLSIVLSESSGTTVSHLSSCSLLPNPKPSQEFQVTQPDAVGSWLVRHVPG
jgi:hypothetical protein